MVPLAFTLAGVLVFAGLLLCAGIATGLWLAVRAARPELLSRRRRTDR
jgi:hypothetical protein